MQLGYYLKLALRQFKRNKSSFLINIIGLSTGLTCALLILLWVIDEYETNKFHEFDSQLFQIMEFQEYSGSIGTTISTPGILSAALKEEFPEVLLASGMDWHSVNTISVGDQNIKRAGRHVSADFLGMFTFPLLAGNASTALAEPSSIVISKSLAEMLFGSVSAAMGQTIRYEHDVDLIVTGVLAPIPPRSTLQFDFLLNWDRWLDANEWANEWGNNGPHSLVLLREDADPDQFSKKIANFIKERDEDDSNVTLFAKQFSSRYLYGAYENGKPAGGRIEYVRLFSIIAIFILLIAAINFMNLSTAKAVNRAKEVGVKKTIGASRGSLISQYLTESLAVAFFSLALALIIAYLILPQFNLITDKNMTLIPSAGVLLSFIALTTITGVLAGSYPAFYLSGFKPVEVLKGTVRSSLGELWARKGLVVFQFAISVFLITAVMVIYQQVQFIKDKNLGYDKDQIVMFDMSGDLEDSPEAFLNALRNQPGIEEVSSIGHNLVGRNNNTSGLSWRGKDPEQLTLFENMRVNFRALETMGVEMKEGRTFSDNFGTDSSKIILNEAAVAVMGLKDPIGESIRLWDQYDFEIIGVVKDFHFQSLHEPIKPVFFWLRPQSTWFVMARLEQGNEQLGIQNMKQEWSKVNPGFPFDYWFIDEDYAELYAAENRVASLSKYFAGIAVIISCLGLFGLAMFTAERRRKEIGIRKVLGATSANIIGLITKEFSMLVSLALLIGLPLSYFIMTNWLSRFEFRIDLQLWYFLFAGLLVLVIAWSTVSSQAYRSALANPTDCLRDE